MQIMLLYKFSVCVIVFIVLFFSSNVDSYYCGQSETKESLLISKNATEGQWPWMVAILRREPSGKNTHWCNGFLIDQRHVLSAAQCFEKRDIEENGLYSTRIGSVNFKKGKEYSVASITLHKKYKPDMFYGDIAILTLNRDVDDPNFNPVCLPDAQLSRENLIGYKTLIVGWGSEKPRGPATKNLHQYRGISVTSNQECNKAFKELIKGRFNRQFPRGVNLAIICGIYKGGESDVCGVTSGGPLMLHERNRWFAVGLVSFGFPCNRPEIPTGYVKISNYFNWIKDVTED